MYEFVADQVFGLNGLVNFSNIVFLAAYSVRNVRTLRILAIVGEGMVLQPRPVDVVARGPAAFAKRDLQHLREFTASRPELRSNFLRIVSADLAAKVHEVFKGIIGSERTASGA